MWQLRRNCRQAVLVVSSLVLLGGCGADERSAQTQSRGTFALPARAKTDDPAYSCRTHCGDMAPSGCYCDDSCASFGDCCPDKQPVCDCPAISPPGPDFCPNGVIDPKYDAQGVCVIGFDCVPCPALSSPGPGFCPNGTIEPRYDDRHVCIAGFDCVPCPALSPAGPDFCPTGTIEPKYDDRHVCVVGFVCVPDSCAGRLYEACVGDAKCEFVVDTSNCPPCQPGDACECPWVCRSR